MKIPTGFIGLAFLSPAFLTACLLGGALLLGCAGTQPRLDLYGLTHDDTEAFRRALASGERRVSIPDLGRPWIISSTIELPSHLELVFEPGVRVEAAPGAFRDTSASLFSAKGQRDIRISGYGARLSMRSAEYRRPPYEASQWRHSFELRAVAGIVVEGLEIASSGGDGIYIGSLPAADRDNTDELSRPCENVVLRDLVLSDHHRQGISVVAVRGLLVTGCRIYGTRGRPPGAGIDFEPNSRDPAFVDCVLENCMIEKNRGPALLVALGRLNPKAPPFSLIVRNCVLSGSPVAFSLFGAKAGARGEISIEGGKIQGLRLGIGTKGVKLSLAP